MHQQVFRNQGEDQSVTQEHSTNGEKTTMNQISWEGRRWAEGRDHSQMDMEGRDDRKVLRGGYEAGGDIGDGAKAAVVALVLMVTRSMVVGGVILGL